MNYHTKMLLGWIICVAIICYTWFRVTDLKREFDRDMIERGFEQQIGGWQKIR